MLDLKKQYIFSEEVPRLIDMMGKKYLVLYFYPKDLTSGCTRQAIDLKENYDAILAHDALVVGVSRDPYKKHAKFISTHELPFDLIADTESELCRLFDVLKMKSMYGRTYEGVERSTFLLDNTGEIVHEWRNVKVPNHLEDLMQVLSEKK